MDNIRDTLEIIGDILGNITMICVEISIILFFTIGTILLLSYSITQF